MPILNLFIQKAYAQQHIGVPIPGTDCRDPGAAVDLQIYIGCIYQFAVYLATGLAIIMIIWGAYMYLTAYGNEEKAEKGKKTIVWAIVGIVVTLLAFAIVTWVWQITAGTAPPPETAPPY